MFILLQKGHRFLSWICNRKKLPTSSSFKVMMKIQYLMATRKFQKIATKAQDQHTFTFAIKKIAQRVQFVKFNPLWLKRQELMAQAKETGPWLLVPKTAIWTRALAEGTYTCTTIDLNKVVFLVIPSSIFCMEMMQKLQMDGKRSHQIWMNLLRVSIFISLQKGLEHTELKKRLSGFNLESRPIVWDTEFKTAEAKATK